MAFTLQHNADKVPLLLHLKFLTF